MTLPFLAPYLLWTKSFHVIALIAWMAGLFYLPRLYVYHCQVARGSEASERFKVMERRLLKQITTPAMIVTWVVRHPADPDAGCDGLGRYLVAREVHRGDPDDAGSTVPCPSGGKDFLEDRNVRPQRFYRYANEVPTVLMVVIVIMAIAQPG